MTAKFAKHTVTVVPSDPAIRKEAQKKDRAPCELRSRSMGGSRRPTLRQQVGKAGQCPALFSAAAACERGRLPKPKNLTRSASASPNLRSRSHFSRSTTYDPVARRPNASGTPQRSDNQAGALPSIQRCASCWVTKPGTWSCLPLGQVTRTYHPDADLRGRASKVGFELGSVIIGASPLWPDHRTAGNAHTPHRLSGSSPNHWAEAPYTATSQ